LIGHGGLLHQHGTGDYEDPAEVSGDQDIETFDIVPMPPSTTLGYGSQAVIEAGARRGEFATASHGTIGH
jgi:hypothetical protein